MHSLTKAILAKAFHRLDIRLPSPLELLIGGGGAMVLAHGESEATADIDAVPVRSKLSLEELRPHLIAVAEELDLPKDWINPYFGSFLFALPSDYFDRVKKVFDGKHLICWALGREDLLVLKLMAGRAKDDRHIRRLMKSRGILLDRVDGILEALKMDSVPGASKALDRFDEYRSDLGIA